MQCSSCNAQFEAGRFCPVCGKPVAAAEPAPAAASSSTSADASETPDISLVGKTLSNKYRVVKLLGEGGMGAVYLGEQPLGGGVRKVAIKTLHPLGGEPFMPSGCARGAHWIDPAGRPSNGTNK